MFLYISYLIYLILRPNNDYSDWLATLNPWKQQGKVTTTTNNDSNFKNNHNNNLRIINHHGDSKTLTDYFLQILQSSPNMSTPVAAVQTLTELVRGSQGTLLERIMLNVEAAMLN